MLARRAVTEAPGTHDGGGAGEAVRLKLYAAAWLVIALLLAREYLILHHHLSGASLFRRLKAHGWLLGAGQALTPEPGAPLSYRLGWLGLGTMALTNLYVLRKRLPAMQNWGDIGAWLDAHIFFGLVGPTLILFHCDFHVRGLVAVSFWSMVIASLSGMVGRYLYVQILEETSALERMLGLIDDYLKGLAWLSPEAATHLKSAALVNAGGSAGGTEVAATGTATLILRAFGGDVKRLLGLSEPHLGRQRLPKAVRRKLGQYGLVARRLQTAEVFRRLMGYWHTFHLPFAVFMYIVAVIHVVATMVFRVRH